MKGNAKPIVTGALVFLVLFLIPIRAAAFSDVPENAPYAKAVEYVNDKGIIEGYSGGQFKPNNTLTRGQIAAIICRMLGAGENLPVNGNLFSDMPSSVWCNGYVTKAVSLNIINGFADGTFRPDHTVSYNQAIAMLLRAFGLREEAESAGGYPNGYLTVANRYHLLDGVDFKSSNGIKRYETAIIIYNYYIGDIIKDWSQTANASLANGEYRVRFFANQINVDQAGNETAYVDILDAVMLDNSYVDSLSVGDKISLKKYGIDDEIIVKTLSKTTLSGGDENDFWVWVDEYTYLTHNGSGWMIWQYDMPIEYVVDQKNLTLAEDTAIIDAYTIAMETGTGAIKYLDNLRSFFQQNSHMDEKVVNITVAEGKVVEVYIPYAPA